MPRPHDCFYENHDATLINLNDWRTFWFDAYPSGIYTPTFESRSIEIPSDLPAAAWQTYVMLPREIAFTLRPVGTPAEIVTNVARMIDLLWADIRDKERGIWTYTADNGITRAIQCSLKSLGDLQNWLKRATCERVAAALPFVLEAQDPTFYNPTTKCETGAFGIYGSVVFDALICQNAGNADAYPRITYEGEVEQPQVEDSYGNVWLIEGTLAAGESLYMNLDPTEFEVTHDDGAGTLTPWAAYVSATSRLPRIAPGSLPLNFTAVSGDATIEVCWEDRYGAHGL